MNLASEIRAEFDRIIKRNFGLPNALGAVRIEVAEKVLAYVDEAEARRCTCCQEPAFEINTDRAETPAYAALRNASIDRMLFGVSQ